MAKRKNYWNVLLVGLTICFSFCMQSAFCQQLQTITDKKDILIGEQIRLTLKASSPFKFILPDSIPHFDIVERVSADSSANAQTITITSFDSGRWVFPPMAVEFPGAGQSPQTTQTDSFFVNVSYSPPDSTNELRDIKPIMAVTIVDYFWYYVIGGALLLLILIFVLYNYFKKNRKEKPAKPVSKLSPYNEAMEELKKLSQFGLQDPVAIKAYHTRLAEIFKHYVGRKQSKDLASKTTGEVLINMRDMNITTDKISELATALRCADAVKFAKYLPQQRESEDCMEKITDTIKLIEQKTAANEQRTTANDNQSSSSKTNLK